MEPHPETVLARLPCEAASDEVLGAEGLFGGVTGKQRGGCEEGDGDSEEGTEHIQDCVSRSRSPDIPQHSCPQ